jgi:hypothetical protein
MALLRWARTHRVLTAFAAGALLVLVALAGVVYFVVLDQRRSARLLAAALSEALDRDVRIERVTELGTERVVMRGVRLPRDGGWPAEVVAERLEATGPLLAAARGEPAPVRLVVSRPAVEVPEGGGGGAGLAALDGLRQGLERFLAGSTMLDVTLTGGTLRGAGGETGFDLTLRKGSRAAVAELVLRPPEGPPLTVGLDARLDGARARLGLSARGGVAALAGWLPPAAAAPLAGRTVELSATAELHAQALAATGTVRLGDVAGAEGTVTLGGGVLEVQLARATLELPFAAAAAGVAWRPSGRAELTDVAATWRPETGAAPTVRAGLRVAALGLPAEAFGTEVRAEAVAGRLAFEPLGAGATLSGTAHATHVRAAGFEAAPAGARYRVRLDAGGVVGRVELADLDVRLHGAALQGTVAYDGTTRYVDARLGGEEVDAGALVRRLVPGWLAEQDRLRLSGLRVTVTGLAPRTLGAGAARFEVRRLRLARPGGDVRTGRATARADLQPAGIRLALDAEGATGSLPAFTGSVPRLEASADLARAGDGSLVPERVAATGRDRQGREMLVASLSPAARPGRFRLEARAPALERLDSLWPAVGRQVSGSARLDVEVATPGWAAADGRLVLQVPAAEVADGKVSVRDLDATLPIRRGPATPGEPPWGTVTVGELIAYGVVARDTTTPARVFQDRLSLNDLTYALYSGDGKGWMELELAGAGPVARGSLTGERVRIEEFISAYGIRGGTMTGLMRYKLDFEYRAGRLALNGRFEVPDGGTVNIELLNRLLEHAGADRTGIVRQAIQNLRAFEYKSAEAEARTVADDVRVSLALTGRERLWGILPPKVREINIRNMPLSFVAKQFPRAD